MCPCFPQFREKAFRNSRHQVTDTFRAAGAALHAEHSLDHKNMVISPKRDLRVVFDEKVLHYEQVGMFLGVRKYLNDRRYFFVVTANGKAIPSDEPPECIPKAWLPISLL